MLPKSARGVLFVFLMIMGVIACTTLTIPWLLTMPLTHPYIYCLRRKYVEGLNKMYFLYNAALITFVGRTSLTIYCNDSRILNDKNILFLSNHRTRVDWMYAGWLYASCLENYPCLSFILKNDLKTWPFFGWCMQMMMYIFLTRQREQDIPRIADCLKYLSKSAKSLAVFIFPEGTDLSLSNLAKSSEYAKANNLLQFEYVLHPKAGGLQVCLKMARENKMIMHDITIAYQDYIDGKRTSELSLLRGEFPKHIHLFVERINPADVPFHEDKLKDWLESKFEDKDRLLAEFYEKSIYGHRSVTAVAKKQLDSWSFVMHSSSRPFWSRQIFPVVVMTFTITLLSYMIWYFYLPKVVFIVLCVFFGIVSSSCGVDTMEMYGKNLADQLFSA